MSVWQWPCAKTSGIAAAVPQDLAAVGRAVERRGEHAHVAERTVCGPIVAVRVEDRGQGVRAPVDRADVFADEVGRRAAHAREGKRPLSGAAGVRNRAGPYSIAIGDLNGNGKADLAIASVNEQPSRVYVLFNRGHK